MSAGSSLPAPGSVLVINAGSSSLKYKVVDPGSGAVFAQGIAERIGERDSRLTHVVDGVEGTEQVDLPDHHAAARMVVDRFAADGVDLQDAGLAAVGHRVVHGGRRFFEPTVLDAGVIEQIRGLNALAPLHNPVNLVGIEAASELLPQVPAVAVFDTAFFHDLPERAARYAIDVDVADEHDVRRYGFHGTSHRYVSSRASELLDGDPATLRQIVLHLGNGASISAIRGGRPIDTSMGMTPLEGLVMGTRSGDIDPGALLHLQRAGAMSVDEIDRLLNKESGLRGLCGVNDFRDIALRIEGGDPAARLALEIYVHRLRHYLGAYLVALGGVDVITFTAGVGENSAMVRAAALAGLEGFGIVLDAERNDAAASSARRISTDDSAVTVLVIPTDEELEIARESVAALAR